jgi:hypothetical protein
MKENEPLSSVTVFFWAEVPRLIRVTEAPLTTAPDASETVPMNDPNVDWAKTGVLKVVSARKSSRRTNRIDSLDAETEYMNASPES